MANIIGDPTWMYLALVSLLTVFLLSSVRIILPNERAVVFRWGRLHRARGPGVAWILPFGVDRLYVVEMKSHTPATLGRV